MCVSFLMFSAVLHLATRYLWHGMLELHPEVVTPVNSALRIKEGIFLQNLAGNAYTGDLVHEQPLLLCLMEFLTESKLDTIALFVCHVLCGCLLSLAAKHMAKDIWTDLSKKKVHSSAMDLVLKEDEYVHQMSRWVLKAYFLNPFILLNFAGGTTTTFQNVLLAASLYGTVKGSPFLAAAPLAMATYQNIYAAPIIIPVGLYTLYKRYPNFKEEGSTRMWFTFAGTFMVFLCTLALLLFSSFKITGSWDFVSSTYGFSLKVPDLRPNIGLFWYFFIEMFEHFESFFLCVFQINAVVYVLPLTIRLYRDPPLLLYVVISLLAIFRSYPCVGDVGFYMSLLPLWSFTFRHSRYNFTVVCMFVASSVLGPILWHLWIYSGSANANFFFAMTLVFNAAQIFLLTDIIFGKMKHDFVLDNGTDMKIDDQEAVLDLE